MKRLLTVLLILAFIPAATVLAEDRDPVVIIKTSMGEISVKLFAREAPKTVANFIDLAEGKMVASFLIYQSPPISLNK